MEIQCIQPGDELWLRTTEYARGCSWRAGKDLAAEMENCHFTEWERVFVATQQDEIAGYCTVSKKDCIPNVAYSPYISFVFVGENHRGRRLSKRMIDCACRYLDGLGFETVYLVSGEKGLYEKYGFVRIDERKSLEGHREQIFQKTLDWTE